MIDPESALLDLEDVLAALWHARRVGDVGRLAHLGCYEVQRWARAARRDALTSHARALLADCPYRSRDEFMFAIDRVIEALEHAHVDLAAGRRIPSGVTPLRSVAHENVGRRSHHGFS